MTGKTNKIWFMSRDEILKEMESSSCIMDLYENIYGNRKCSSGMYKRLRERCKELNIDLDILKHRNRKFCDKIPNEKVFCKNSRFDRRGLKRRILEDDLIEYTCKVCGLGPKIVTPS